MKHLLSQLLLYQEVRNDPVLRSFSNIMDEIQTKGQPDPVRCDDMRAEIHTQIRHILDCGTTYGFDGNLWQNYLCYLIINDENPYALVSEKRPQQLGSASAFARSDYDVLRQLMHMDFSVLEETLSINCFSLLTHYQAIVKPERLYYHNVSAILRSLSRSLADAGNAEEFQQLMTEFYSSYGVGMLGLNRAFRIGKDDTQHVRLLPINNLESVTLDDLIGYDTQKKQLYDNTLAFVEGRTANNVLLYGDAGTGKSTSIKAIVNTFYAQGLRMIEIYKHQFQDLSTVISMIKGRNYRFIIYMDDLSFEEFEIEYKYLKAVIEGGMETRPDNILIYATSNRRHLVRETWKDRNDMEHDGDIHRSDTMEEKLSLVDRFGLNILYAKPSFDEYHQIVCSLAEKHGIQMDRTELLRAADQWSVRKAGYSGRIAQQFINSLNPLPS